MKRWGSLRRAFTKTLIECGCRRVDWGGDRFALQPYDILIHTGARSEHGRYTSLGVVDEDLNVRTWIDDRLDIVLAPRIREVLRCRTS